MGVKWGASTFGRNTKRLEIAAIKTKFTCVDYIEPAEAGFVCLAEAARCGEKLP